MSAGRFATGWGRHFTTRWGRGRHAGRHDLDAKLVSRLRTLPGPTPEAGFRSDLRTQLVAITGRIVSESETAPAGPATAPTSGAHRAASATGRNSRGRAVRALRRPVLVLASAATVLVMLLGMAVWMSSGSLPGESLYSVKRASENVQLSMAGSDVAKGQAYLELAGNRVREAAKLLSRPSAMPVANTPGAAGGQISAHTASLVSDTLASADDETVHGMQLLSRAAVAQMSKDPLAKMTTWWPGQNTRMTEVRNRIPAGALRTRAQTSLVLLQRIATRTGQLSTAMGCPCLARALADELGPVPCSPCAVAPNPGGGTTLPVPVPGVGTTPSGPLPTVSLPQLGGGTSTSSSPRAASLPPVQPSVLPTTGPSILPAALPTVLPTDPTGSPSGFVLPSLPAPGLPVPSLPDLPGAAASVASGLLGGLPPVPRH
ncbi:DUF5667 domain-containing protein [Jatrophihabitans sp.]|uniref:DUF5667 domain-containing protein n=1 Tax=Jatrophihabitans sp. TaxID=1932789 RepID=UPI002C33F6DE|nr:DUF5667 domain-containing protein [Jatrophihabitans sp.]